MPILFKRGQTFDFTGQLTSKGAPYPLAGCTLYADIRTQPNFAFVQHMTCTILDLTTSLVQIYAAAADTAKWLAMPHLLDVRLVNAAGKVLISNTVEIDVLDTVTGANTA
jgi:hypothetical protein